MKNREQLIKDLRKLESEIKFPLYQATSRLEDKVEVTNTLLFKTLETLQTQNSLIYRCLRDLHETQCEILRILKAKNV